MLPAEWKDTHRSRSERDRETVAAVPASLPLLDSDLRVILARWVSDDAGRRSRPALLKASGYISIERAEVLCDLLLREGWIIRREKLIGGSWQWQSLAWRNLQLLQALLGVSSPRLRIGERGTVLSDATDWLSTRRDSASGDAVDPDLQDELEQSIERLAEDKGLRIDLLRTRLELIRAIVAWHDAGADGSRRDFSLQARGTTKALSESEWRWLEANFDLERLRIFRFAPMAWLAGDIELIWEDSRVQLRHLHCIGLPLADVRGARGGLAPRRWWLIENRASFERQSQQRSSGVGLIWMPGRPSQAWLDAIGHLLDVVPAPARISADADPAGVDIACAVGAIWEAHGLAWEPYRMGVTEWTETSQHWPLNTHDQQLIDVLLAKPRLPEALRALCTAMQLEGRKAEQEGWL